MIDMPLTDTLIVGGAIFYSAVALSVALGFITWLWLDRHNL